MGWKIVETGEDGPDVLSDRELVGMSVMLAQNSLPNDVYRRAWEKIQPAVEVAIERA